MKDKKRCIGCGHIKPITEYNWSVKDLYLQSYCKPCFSTRSSKYYKENKEERVAYNKKYRSTQQAQEVRGKWIEENKPYFQKYHREYQRALRKLEGSKRNYDPETNTKRCKKCDQPKDYHKDFYQVLNKKQNKYYATTVCKDCCTSTRRKLLEPTNTTKFKKWLRKQKVFYITRILKHVNV